MRSCRYIRVRDVRTVTFIKRLEAMKKDPRIKSAQVVRTSCAHDVSLFTAFLLAVVSSHTLFPRQFSRRLCCVQPLPPIRRVDCAAHASRAVTAALDCMRQPSRCFRSFECEACCDVVADGKRVNIVEYGNRVISGECNVTSV
jgi:hypothetical protein